MSLDVSLSVASNPKNVENSSVNTSKDVISNPLSKKLSKILDTRLDNDKDMLEALKSLSIFFTENNIRTRRNLRGDIEKRTLNINEEFIGAFAVVKEQLDSIYKDVEAINACCQDMISRLKKTKSQTHDLISQTTTLKAETHKLQLRNRLVDAFLLKFQLTEEEKQALKTGRDGQLRSDFFTALVRVKQIHNDCKLLLRTNHQTAGLEIMESMALQQETAYEKLYRWTQNECCLLSTDSPDISLKLSQAIAALYDRPVLFKYSIDEFGNARRAAVVRNFIDALTRGGPGGNPRPIELHSHDPLRYLGDMLAWIHQSTASEKEHAQALLKNCQMIDNAIEDILMHITEGPLIQSIINSIQVRIEQVLTSEPGPILLYKLSNLLQFYISTISQMMPSTCVLVHTLDEMFQLSRKVFFSSLSFAANKLIDKVVEQPPADLTPTDSIQKVLALLQGILSSNESSVASADEKRGVFLQILTYMVEPLVQACSLSASQLPPVDMATYMVNSLHVIQCVVALYEFTDQRLEMLQAQIDAHMDTLVNEHASLILHHCGLTSLCTSLQLYARSEEPLSKMSGMDVASVKAAMAKLDGFLSNPDPTTMGQCNRVQSSKFRDQIKRRTTELICMAYSQLYSAISDPKNQYPSITSIAPIEPGQVARLLS
ncbi:hypothetical protein HELRODRAFT_112997 [Helobdella robusta]|uniref:Conserved oligomeric Golgi complex subunit 6 n=1 Tax=Helobdella robusta TaxID=6412 RepID=T1EFP4_HELRO|nr:hypothetical protein HELRODRAFT_112997 [Helobdella robusta]ESO00870.1 hypothetical protein HELRODRAFT_112997 [Helobdella robusta]